MALYHGPRALVPRNICLKCAMLCPRDSDYCSGCVHGAGRCGCGAIAFSHAAACRAHVPGEVLMEVHRVHDLLRAGMRERSGTGQNRPTMRCAGCIGDASTFLAYCRMCAGDMLRAASLVAPCPAEVFEFASFD